MTPSTSFAISSPNSARIVLDLDAGVLDGVVEERGGDRRLVQPQAGEDLRRAPRVVDELLARAAQLAVVRVRPRSERAGDQLAVDIGLVGLELGEQLVDEILMPLELPASTQFTLAPAPTLPADSRARRQEIAASTRKPASPCFVVAAAPAGSASPRARCSRLRAPY